MLQEAVEDVPGATTRTVTGKCALVGNSCGECRASCDDVERCNDGIDNDCNGLVDCADPACSEVPGCLPTDAGACVEGSTCLTSCGSSGNWDCGSQTCQPPAEICDDGIDNDCNGHSDCDDAACAGASSCCSGPTVCDVFGCNGEFRDRLLALPAQIKQRQGCFRVLNWR